MKPSTHLLAIAASFFVATSPVSCAADFTIRVLGWNDTTRTSRIYATDGLNYLTAIPVNSGTIDVGDPPAPSDYTDYLASIPDVWFSENRGLGFHVPGYGNTFYSPINSYGGACEIDLNSPVFGTYHTPSQNPSGAGNQLLLGHWWNSALAVATLNTWDNENEYWPAIGIDFNASHQNAFWRWLRPIGNSSEMQVVMDVDYRHRLTVTSPSDPSQRILLDPELGRITINGQAVLTSALAATQFVTRTASSVSFGSGTLLRDPQPEGEQVGQLVLGKYNDTNTTDPVSGNHLEGVLIVGTGTSAATADRRNGLRILDDGTVLLLPKGDLRMGFTAGPRP